MRKEHEILSQQEVRGWFSDRTLEGNCGPLVPLLQAGMNVLDVGCGPGSITLGVARRVAPGQVTGIDIGERSIEQARKAAAEQQVVNVEFVTHDAVTLPFEDGRFDLTYSNGLAEWLRTPLPVFREQVRVTKKGGWLVAIVGMPDKVIGPDCLTFQRMNEARKLLDDPKTEGVYYNGRFTNGMVSIFRALELQDLVIEPYFPQEEVAFQESRYFDTCYHRLIGMAEILSRGKTLHMAGLDKDALPLARAEIDRWHKDPDAFVFGYRVFIAGRTA